MSAMLKLLAIVICMNTFIYLGTSYATGAEGATDEKVIKVQGDLFDLLLSKEGKEKLNQDLDNYKSGLETGEYISGGISYNISSNITSLPNMESGTTVEITQGGFSFLDSIRIIWAFIATLLNILISPITLLSVGKLPPLIIVILGIPLSLLGFVTILMFIRGVS